MPSSGRALLAVAAVAATTFGTVLGAQSVAGLYSDMLTQETVLRAALENASQPATRPEDASALVARVRTTVASYEGIARRFPTSGYSDNALWQAAVLSADAFWQYGDARDRAAALRLFARLRSEFPTSSLIARISGHTSRLDAATAGAHASALAMLTAVRSEVLQDAVRITLELGREAAFTEDREPGASRVALDLHGTQATEALRGATISFPGDVVRQASIGPPMGDRTRLVFDVEGTARHSIYPLYDPYRLVIDFERPTPVVLPAKPARSAKTSPVAPTRPRPTAAPVKVAAAPPSTATANKAGGFSLSRQLGLGVARVVIDPGHGGRDPGAQVQGLDEADVVLDVALELERLLAMEPNVEVVLTRRTNTYVPLEERTAIANRAEADLFLSIHLNASENPSARGFETYFLNFASNPEAEALAARENAGSARTMSSLPDIVKAIALNNKIDESRDFAAMVQRALQDRLRKADPRARNLGVKQAPFMVLIGATMPSVLVEVSFLTNQSEATLLRSPSHRKRVAEALLAGVMTYQQSLKRSSTLRSAR